MASLIDSPAPSFTLPDQEGELHSLSDYTGMWVLLYFYPKDDTPGCTVEACSVRDSMNDFNLNGVQVLGVSKDSVKSHAKFAKKHQLNFPLLADSETTVIQEYGVWKEKSMFGKTFMGIRRDSFLINPEGIIVKRYDDVKPEEHVQTVLADVKAAKK
jgi:peroxiredoxin Q/BCP